MESKKDTMTQEEQNLLIDDMLPRIRRSKLLARNSKDWHLLRICGVGSFGAYIFARDTDSYYTNVTVDLTDITVYLRSMSTMTEAEENEYNALNGYERGAFPSTVEAFDWLLEHRFDYRGLIGKGLAEEEPSGIADDV